MVKLSRRAADTDGADRMTIQASAEPSLTIAGDLVAMFAENRAIKWVLVVAASALAGFFLGNLSPFSVRSLSPFTPSSLSSWIRFLLPTSPSG
jgi:hypothetical protein